MLPRRLPQLKLLRLKKIFEDVLLDFYHEVRNAIDAFLEQYLERRNDRGFDEIVDTDDLSDSNANIDASVAIVSVETAPAEENVDSSLPPVSAESSDENIFEDVLLDFYEKANGDNWTNNDGWGVGDYCTWYGITCDGVEVTQIRLEGNNLNGIISKELGNLTNLTELILYFNQLTGSIPTELGNLTNLTTLNLFGNRLSGSIPSELGNLTTLTSLSLYGNQLTGSIPAELGTLSNLTYLGLYSNQLSGSIPSELGNLTSLITLFLNHNSLTGPIPESFSNFKRLKTLTLSDNNLTGVVPGFLRNGDIEFLYLEGNNFDAEVSAEQELIDSLNTLNEMHENGLLTDEELELAKRKILQ